MNGQHTFWYPHFIVQYYRSHLILFPLHFVSFHLSGLVPCLVVSCLVGHVRWACLRGTR